MFRKSMCCHGKLFGLSIMAINALYTISFSFVMCYDKRVSH